MIKNENVNLAGNVISKTTMHTFIPNVLRSVTVHKHINIDFQDLAPCYLLQLLKVFFLSEFYMVKWPMIKKMAFIAKCFKVYMTVL